MPMVKNKKPLVSWLTMERITQIFLLVLSLFMVPSLAQIRNLLISIPDSRLMRVLPIASLEKMYAIRTYLEPKTLQKGPGLVTLHRTWASVRLKRNNFKTAYMNYTIRIPQTNLRTALEICSIT